MKLYSLSFVIFSLRCWLHSAYPVVRRGEGLCRGWRWVPHHPAFLPWRPPPVRYDTGDMDTRDHVDNGRSVTRRQQCSDSDHQQVCRVLYYDGKYLTLWIKLFDCFLWSHSRYNSMLQIKKKKVFRNVIKKGKRNRRTKIIYIHIKLIFGKSANFFGWNNFWAVIMTSSFLVIFILKILSS